MFWNLLEKNILLKKLNHFKFAKYPKMKWVVSVSTKLSFSRKKLKNGLNIEKRVDKISTQEHFILLNIQ